MEYISHVVQHGNLSDDEWWKFLRNSRDKQFLFGKDVQDFIEALYNKGLDIQSINEALKHAPKGDERTRLSKRKTEIFQWFKSQFDESRELFSRYLRIDKK
ncbi:MAG TPA: hypothetical protein VNI77_05980 [Nitrososphaera sp.]|nr:hypothetical protein [Nitrososphaera sp.]